MATYSFSSLFARRKEASSARSGSPLTADGEFLSRSTSDRKSAIRLLWLQFQNKSMRSILEVSMPRSSVNQHVASLVLCRQA